MGGQAELWQVGRASHFIMPPTLMILQSNVVSYEFGLSTTPFGDDEGMPDLAPLVYIGLGDQAAVIDVLMEHAHLYYGVVRTVVSTRVPQP